MHRLRGYRAGKHEVFEGLRNYWSRNGDLRSSRYDTSEWGGRSSERRAVSVNQSVLLIVSDRFLDTATWITL